MRMLYRAGYPYPFNVAIGQAIPTAADPVPPQPPNNGGVIQQTGDALRNITPALLILGVAGGAAFAIGSGLVHRYFFNGRR